jgi:hypothetical protein
MYSNLKKLRSYTGIKEEELQEYGNVGKEKSMPGSNTFVIRK